MLKFTEKEITVMMNEIDHEVYNLSSIIHFGRICELLGGHIGLIDIAYELYNLQERLCKEELILSDVQYLLKIMTYELELLQEYGEEFWMGCEEKDNLSIFQDIIEKLNS